MIILSIAAAAQAGSSYIDVLIQRLFANDVNVSQRAFDEATRLDKLEKGALVDQLRGMTGQDDPFVRRQAFAYIQALVPTVDRDLVDAARLAKNNPPALESAPLPEPPAPTFANESDKDSWEFAQAAKHSTSRSLVSETVSNLTTRLSDPDPEERRAAIHVLAELGSQAKEAVPSLAKCLNDPNEDVRSEAQVALQRING